MANYNYGEVQEYLNYYRKGGKLTFSQWLGHPYTKPKPVKLVKKPKGAPKETTRTKGVSQQALQSITEKELRKMK